MCKSKTDNCSARATLSKKTSHRQQPERHRWELEYPHQGQERHQQALTIPQQGLERHHHGLERSRQGPQHHHQRPEDHSKRRECYHHQGHTFYFIRGLAYCFGWGRTGCTASRDRHCKTQPECRRGFQRHARQPPASIETHFGPRRRNTGYVNSHPGLRKRQHLESLEHQLSHNRQSSRGRHCLFHRGLPQLRVSCA